MPKIDRDWLVFRRSIETERRPGATSKAITEYLQDIGFSVESSSPSYVFQRGRVMGGVTAFDPRNYRTEVRVDVLSGVGKHLVEVEWRVNRFAAWPTSADLDCWRVELDGIEQAATTGFADERISHYAAQRAFFLRVSIWLGIVLAALLLLMAATGAWVALI